MIVDPIQRNLNLVLSDKSFFVSADFPLIDSTVQFLEQVAEKEWRPWQKILQCNKYFIA